MHDRPDCTTAPDELRMIAVDVVVLTLQQRADHALSRLCTVTDELEDSRGKLPLKRREPAWWASAWVSVSRDRHCCSSMYWVALVQASYELLTLFRHFQVWSG